ncbi:3-hydroxybutyryl-CoA dehydrogenase [Paucilactobacillus oligofermentans DSM 15707 = LMG 22743]|uniref:3-hydroxybutyryl-CoA dehydrogenase n=1 Tax=Paucilactobacillus oligofermentans DSM 15707 = LMG 22743 TaxID=1423778 RepID=A0A0R1RXG6_9LACO|nr:3-hydroxyacyl-CoA dehydrogenase [Paucilactobacillus oligofermentans]KRL57819.1 3-hydroxybutyryl-CoA dehydrogenase [Paucilactobacillus oligofermentans DSM 15707 = LMG 22743]CUS26721.1 3-hydroxyacyl-CoA dehydrogenase [Paucilactobacillus oligofermentans DSM 15707 = LMG 22743]
MNIKHVTVAGSGVLGSQIAFQTAFKGFEVTIYDINDEVLETAKTRVGGLAQLYQEEIAKQQGSFKEALSNMEYNRNLLPNVKDDIFTQIHSAGEGALQAVGRISYSSDLAVATKNADLVIEAIPEVITIKESFYKNLGKVAPEHTIFATNSSTLLPSAFAAATGRPSQFLALHFANNIWKNNTAEIMAQSQTDPKIFEEVVDFAKAIGMIAIELKKEQAGYILNSLLVPFLTAGQMLELDGISDPQTIDKTWMLATKAPMGPFAILDIVGIKTVYNIVLNYAKTTGEDKYQKLADLMMNDYINKGKLGVATGEGFYTYPNPAYEAADFLEG